MAVGLGSDPPRGTPSDSISEYYQQGFLNEIFDD